MFGGPDHREGSLGGAGGGPSNNAFFSGEIASGDRGGIFRDLPRGTLGQDLSAVASGPRAHVDHMVGPGDRLFVVFDDDHRISQVAKVKERFEELPVVPGMESDGGFVEDVEDSREPGPDLCGQPDPLGFSARKGLGGAREGQVVHAHFGEEVQAAPDLPQDLFGDLLLFGGEAQRIDGSKGLPDRQLRKLMDVESSDRYGKALGLEPGSVAGGAGFFGEHGFELGPGPCPHLSPLVDLSQEGNEPLEAGFFCRPGSVVGLSVRRCAVEKLVEKFRLHPGEGGDRGDSPLLHEAENPGS